MKSFASAVSVICSIVLCLKNKVPRDFFSAKANGSRMNNFVKFRLFCSPWCGNTASFLLEKFVFSFFQLFVSETLVFTGKLLQAAVHNLDCGNCQILAETVLE